jgi:hypothetical protein
VEIELPRRFGCIGIIDGQHRIFAYHEGVDALEEFISTLRNKQHLLVTGIVYPERTKALDAQRFEAKLFLEINDKQKRVRGDLKQAIERIVRPRSAVAVAKAVVNELASSPPFAGMLETHFFDSGMVKTTSIVSYGLRYVVDPDKNDSLMVRWNDSEKGRFQTDDEILHRYVLYCSSVFREFFNAFKEHVGADMWTLDRTVSRVLNATTINGLIYTMRRLVIADNVLKFGDYRSRFSELKVSFSPGKFKFKSSHWKDLGDKILADCFSDLIPS